MYCYRNGSRANNCDGWSWPAGLLCALGARVPDSLKVWLSWVVDCCKWLISGGRLRGFVGTQLQSRDCANSTPIKTILCLKMRLWGLGGWGSCAPSTGCNASAFGIPTCRKINPCLWWERVGRCFQVMWLGQTRSLWKIALICFCFFLAVFCADFCMPGSVVESSGFSKCESQPFSSTLMFSGNE